MAVLLATAALTLAACGDSSDGTDSTASSTSTAPTTSSSSTTTPSSTTTSSSKTTSSPRTTTTSSSAASSDVRQAFDSALRQSLVQQGDLTSSQIDCVLNELHRTLPDSQIQAGTSTRVSQAVIDAASQAGLKCTNR